ncbi:3-oxoacyl-[acyl-carrier-protein] synthase II [Syntrophus gentianae]|uniref:Nodulation protein E n=1 Tax=Syntrophus gentianae TaxID=43775 RepID=A0A1H7UGH8_9BACT|nr:beta-ketoacyl-[acyl-carrier-protein] synthase family protein [Syntrophus gentianae]SEL96182.1 3-oxoacyl-[acyl-carrier-protein] synthase II [Syntrophus gentianae]
MKNLANQAPKRRRVVITGLGAISSLGNSPEQVLSSLRSGRVSFAASSSDPQVISSPVRDFELGAFTGSFKERRYLNRGAQLTVAAAMSALRSSSLRREELAETGLFLGAGPNMDVGGEVPEIRQGEIQHDSLMALWILRFLPNTAASIISILAGLRGDNLTVTSACSSSLQAIGEAFHKIRDGYLDLALAGGGDSRLTPGAILAYRKARALYEGGGNPEEASRPFDSGRRGFVPGEGGACLLLEELEHARRRRADIYGEVCGFGASLDGYNVTAPEPEGKGGQMALEKALADAGLVPGDVDAVSTHGTGTILNDRMEAALIERVYAGVFPRILAFKSWIGHLSTACGAMETALSLICMLNDYLPEIRNLREPCSPVLPFVRKGGSCPASTWVIENFGFGGQNAVLMIRRYLP